MSGFIKLHRGWHKNAFFKADEPFCEPAAWAWLLTNAAWKETTRRTGQGGVIRLQRGEIHVSLSSLATSWRWSVKRVRGFIDRLEKGHMAGTSKGKDGTVLSITNYEKYQGGTDAEGTPTGTGKGTVGAQSGHTQEEGKEGKEEENKGDYAFAGEVIRLSFSDYRRWQNAFPDLELRALLTARDDWLRFQPEADQKRWFPSTSVWLAKQQQEAARNRPADQLRPGGIGI